MRREGSGDAVEEWWARASEILGESRNGVGVILAFENRQQYGDDRRFRLSLTTTDGVDVVREYGYDGAGRRTSVRGAETGDYSYGWGGQPTTVSEGGVTTSTGYDGLGRAVTRQVDTAYSSDRVTNTYLGGAVMGVFCQLEVSHMCTRIEPCERLILSRLCTRPTLGHVFRY